MNKSNIALLSLLCFSISLGGCKNSASEQASTEAAAAKAELTKVKGVLEQTQKERDDLKAKVAAITESLKTAQTKIDSLVQSTGQAADMKDKLAALAKDRDAANAKAADSQSLIEQLKSQLQAQIQKVTGLEGQNKKLQDLIDQLKKQLGGDVKVPALPKL